MYGVLDSVSRLQRTENICNILSCKNISAGLFSAREHALTFRERALNSFNAKNTLRARKSMHYCRRDSHATSRTAIYANVTQTGRIWVYCSWFWVVLVGFDGFVGGFGWFWVVPCFSNYDISYVNITSHDEMAPTSFISR